MDNEFNKYWVFFQYKNGSIICHHAIDKEDIKDYTNDKDCTSVIIVNKKTMKVIRRSGNNSLKFFNVRKTKYLYIHDGYNCRLVNKNTKLAIDTFVEDLLIDDLDQLEYNN